MVVVDESAFSSEAVEDIAAENITANREQNREPREDSSISSVEVGEVRWS